MTGRQIADNLSRNGLQWVKGHFLLREKKGGRAKYCALGQKLHEAGVSDEVLDNLGDTIWIYPDMEGCVFVDIPAYEEFCSGRKFSKSLDELVSLNDDCVSKEAVIEELRSREWAKETFDIEGYRKAVLKAQADLEKARKKFKTKQRRK
jgi:hypothetical protein